MAELKELQTLVAKVRRERGFTTDPIRIYALLNEEIGEIGGELKKTWSPNYDSFDSSRLADELADSMVLLCALASEFKVDLETAIRSKLSRRSCDTSPTMRVWRSWWGMRLDTTISGARQPSELEKRAGLREGRRLAWTMSAST